ncbi:unnamed protein product [Anisakis simplex]|uniref:DUF7083 domain-containing protein n=1 Tax=Anisakis simplex TaxID=6269 RepID=A0A0M3JCF6_ANISI|nr:unnamed protein product [Anisakis simplex]
MNDINDSSSTTVDPLIMLLQQQQQQMQQFGTLLTLLQQKTAGQRTSTPRQPSTAIASSAMDSVLENTITTFSYAPYEDITFAAWYKRYEDIFKMDGKNLDDAARVHFLLTKLDAVVYEKYSNYILPH